MDPTTPLTAADIVAHDEAALADILRRYGEERLLPAHRCRYRPPTQKPVRRPAELVADLKRRTKNEPRLAVP